MQPIRFKSTDLDPYPLNVQGESYHREEIEKVIGYYDEDEGINDDTFWAQLILDDGNKADPGIAVAVKINNRTVGYLSSPAAKKYRKRLQELGLGEIIGECRASIKGGFTKKSTGEQADFGVRLDLDLDTFKPWTAPMQKEVQSAPAIVSPAAAVVQPELIPKAEKEVLNPVQKFMRRFSARDTLTLIIIVVIVIAGLLMNR